MASQSKNKTVMKEKEVEVLTIGASINNYDIVEELGEENIKNTITKEYDEFKWLKNNAYKYGFIQRFPKGYEEITGFRAEQWHYRYVGKKIAKYCYNNDMSLEEYYARKIDKLI